MRTGRATSCYVADRRGSDTYEALVGRGHRILEVPVDGGLPRFNYDCCFHISLRETRAPASGERGFGLVDNECIMHTYGNREKR